MPATVVGTLLAGLPYALLDVGLGTWRIPVLLGAVLAAAGLAGVLVAAACRLVSVALTGRLRTGPPAHAVTSVDTDPWGELTERSVALCRRDLERWRECADLSDRLDRAGLDPPTAVRQALYRFRA